MSSRPDRHYQVVGVDGSVGSKHALAWAVHRTEQLGPVEPLAAWHYPWWAFVPTTTSTALPVLGEKKEEEFGEITARLVNQSLEGLDPSNVLDPVTVHGSAGPALVSVGSQASLIVVGTRGHGALASGLLGSVSSYCATHATVPVIVVPTEAPIEDRHGVVVVGFDGSDHALRAIDWAAENTPPTTQIRVVHVWNPSTSVTAQVEAMATDRLSTESLTMVNEVVDEFRSRVEGGDRVFTAVSESGDARSVLRSMATDADMVIVGVRGGGQVAHLPLGSVSSSLVHHPTVTTVVVR